MRDEAVSGRARHTGSSFFAKHRIPPPPGNGWLRPGASRPGAFSSAVRALRAQAG
ncbi:hypothetical protein BURMUCF2_A0181 [Burkholderia multivorans CF2]|nr:hypothetical protein BURMUCF2_A0181 [Burkholderia multivorans CF2]